MWWHVLGAFAQRFKLSNSQAYAYLRRFTGIDFLLESCYAARATTLSIDDAVSRPPSTLAASGREDRI
ncbi:MAG: DUF3791 domain-containing protein [Bacteroides cellulosilyticus]